MTALDSDLKLDSAATEKMYPLNFVLHYVMKKKEELVNLEAKSLHGVTRLSQHSRALQKQLQALAADAGGHPALAREVVERQAELREELRQLRAGMTEKTAVFDDISNLLEQTEYLITHLIFRDTLTATYNRYFFVSQADIMFAEAQQRHGMSLAFLDIDNFKQYNDRYGHQFGDEVLVGLTNMALTLLKRHTGTELVRMGGDEFVILNNGGESFESFVELLEELREAVHQHEISLGDAHAHISLSMGAANAQVEGTRDSWTLYRRADDRLYVAKERGKNCLVYQ